MFQRVDVQNTNYISRYVGHVGHNLSEYGCMAVSLGEDGDTRGG